MKDMLGQVIRRNDFVAYPVTHNYALAICIGEVEAVGDEALAVWPYRDSLLPDFKATMLSFVTPHNVVKLSTCQLEHLGIVPGNVDE